MNTILLEQTKSILEEKDLLAALCNTAALLYDATDNINWLGFYLYKNGELVLGPFAGKVACTHIAIGKGVCGTSFEEKKILNVKNVYEFKGHIACDSASKSELVIPLGNYGVLDIDAPVYERFTSEDEETFSQIGKLIEQRLATASL